MKHYALLIIFLLLSSMIVLAQDTEDMRVKQEKKTETEEERLERMLDAFDRESVVQDSIVVSFTATTNKQQAIRIFENFDLTLSETKVCVSIVNPGEEPQDEGCSVVDSWNNDLRIATADVPAGKTLKTLALQLYQHDDVEWVEPSYTASLADGSANPRPPQSTERKEPLGTLGDALQEEVNIFERIWQWLKGLFT